MTVQSDIPTVNAVRPLSEPRRVAGVRSRIGGLSERYAQWWLLAPALLVMCGILVYPLLFSLWVSLFDWRMAATTHAFIGLQNYAEALTSSFFEFVFLQSIGFT